MDRALAVIEAARRGGGECWIVTGHDNGNDYRRMWHQGHRRYVHRISYEHFVGPIPASLTIDHLCRVRACCNPAHMEPVTRAENARREALARISLCRHGKPTVKSCQVCRREQRVRSGELLGLLPMSLRTHCPHGHPYDAENTVLVRRPDGSVKQRACRECRRNEVRGRRARRKEGALCLQEAITK